MIAVVTGTPGVGKTTVLNKALERIGESHEVINFGDEMLKVAAEKKLANNRDEIRKLSTAKQRSLQMLAAKSIAKKGKKKNIIVDTHCTVKTPRGYLCGLPKWVLDELDPEIIVIIDADAEEIMSRRSRDATRARDADTFKVIEEQRLLNRAAAVCYSMYTGATVAIVENKKDGLEKAADELVALLK